MPLALQIDSAYNRLIYDAALTYPKLVLNEMRTSANAYNNFDEDPNYRLYWSDSTHMTLTKTGNTYTLSYNGNLAQPTGYFAVKMKMPQNQRFLTVSVGATQSTSSVIIYYSGNSDISYSSDNSKTWFDNAGWQFNAGTSDTVPFPDYRCRCAVYFHFGRLEAGQSLPKTITITFGTASAPPSQQNQQQSSSCPIVQQEEEEEELETELEEPQVRLLRDDEFYNAINGQDPVEQQDT